MILLSVAIGVGYINFTAFNDVDFEFFTIPMICVAVNTICGFISVYMLLDAKRIQENKTKVNHMRLGSL